MAQQLGALRAATRGRTLETLPFDNQSLKQLPLDKERRNFVRPQVKDACFSLCEPEPVKNPMLCAVAKRALDLLGLDWAEADRPEFAEYFSGNRLLPGSQTAAHCYCGHQFGYFSGQLGDGAAMYLGEVLSDPPAEHKDADGADVPEQPTGRWELQLKGSGPTPYSRQADGRKVLRSSIREFLCSEAMWGLGIPTTRAGTLVTSDTWVARDMFYDGRVKKERASVISRIAPCFIRFGSFEIVKPLDKVTGRTGSSPGNLELLQQLLHFVIRQHFPQLWTENAERHQDMYLEFFMDVVRRTAQLVADWQTVGFCHGVLNTDNMSILGLTIDYGPYGFMGHFDPGFVCNTSDEEGRYSYENQPDMCRWNCEKLAEALDPLLPLKVSLPVIDEVFQQAFDTRYYGRMRLKLGLLPEPCLQRVAEQYTSGVLPELPRSTGASSENVLRNQSEHFLLHHWDHAGQQHLADSLEPVSAAEKAMIDQLLTTMAKTSTDFTNAFRALALVDATLPEDSPQQAFLDYVLQQCATGADLKRPFENISSAITRDRLVALSQLHPVKLMNMGIHPLMVQRELERMDKVDAIDQVSEADRQAQNLQLWQAWVRPYVRLLVPEAQARRVACMQQWNPSVVLRNWIAQHSIKLAEGGPAEERSEDEEAEDREPDFSEIQRVLSLVAEPYRDRSTAAVRSPEPPFPNSEIAPQPPSLLRQAAAAAQSEQPGECRIVRQTVVRVQYDSVNPDWMRETVLAVSCSS